MQRRRLFFQLGFFALFLLAPALNLLRFDLNETQLWFLGLRWSLGIDGLLVRCLRRGISRLRKCN